MPATNAAWAGATLTVTVSGSDVSCDVVACTVDRSQNRVWNPPDAGTCQLTLDLEASGQPSTRGPVGAIVTVKIAYGATNRTLFTGTVQQRRRVATAEADTLVLDCVDGFETLSRLNVRADVTDLPVGDGDSIADRIGRWLDVADWPSSSLARALDLSDFTCPATALEGNVLLQIQAAAQADGGDFFIDGAGVATFKAWNWRTVDNTVDAVFSDRRLHAWVPYTTAELVDDLDEVQNKVTGTRRPLDDTDVPVPQTAVDPSSVTAYGERGDALDDLELETDGQVASRVAALVSVAAGPNQRFESVVVQPAFDPARSWPRTIPVTVQSLIGANRLWADGRETALYAHVIGEQWSFTPDDATVEFRCSGTGTWDTIRPPRPPLALERCDDGTLHVPDGYPCDTESTIYIKDSAGVILATYPPGSLCECGIVEIPDGGVELCLDNGSDVQTCITIDDERLDALLWFDVEDDTRTLIERIDGDPVTAGPGFASTELDVIPGGYDAIHANSIGGVIGSEHDTHLAAAPFASGWKVDFRLDATDLTMAPGSSVDVIALDSVAIRITTAYSSTPHLEVLTVNDTGTGDVVAMSGELWPITAGWDHYVVEWIATAGTLTVYIDGALVHAAAFTAPARSPSGDWTVTLPADCSIGEVLVYAGAHTATGHYDETVLADGPYAYWTLDAEDTWAGTAYDVAVTGDNPYAYFKLDTEV